MLGLQTQFIMNTTNYNTHITVAIFINGSLAAQTSYTIANATFPETDQAYITGFTDMKTLSAGTVVALAVVCQTPFIAFASNNGESYEASSSSIPGQLPSSPITVPYTIQMYAFKE
jgi:hypothetical protein